ncbi:hypothetical protein ACHAPC_004608 [Botrytis cinerea]
METNRNQQTGRKGVTPSAEEDLLSFDDIVTAVPPTILSSSVAPYTSRDKIPSASGNGDAIADVSSGYLKQATVSSHSAQVRSSSNGNQGDAKSSPSLSPDSKLEFIFGPPLREPEKPFFNKSSYSFRDSSLFAQQPFTNFGQGLSSLIVNTAKPLLEASLVDESLRSSSPDLIQFTPPKQNLPKEEREKAKTLQIHASKSNSSSFAFLSLNPFSSSSLPRTTGGLSRNRASSSMENSRTLDPKILKPVIINNHQGECFQEASRTGIPQADTFDKSSLAKTADMDLSPVSHHADVLATTVTAQHSAIAAQNAAQSSKMPGPEAFLLAEKDEAGSPVVISLGSANQIPSGNISLQLDSPSLENHSPNVTPINKVPTPFALSTRTTDDVFAELRRPLHPQAIQSQIDIKTSSCVDSYNTNDEILDNNQGSNQKDLHVVEKDKEEEEEEDMNQAIPDIKRISARKQKNAAIFDVFLKEATKLPKTEKTSHANDEAIQSTRWLIDQAEKQHIIESPRDYQLELFEKAKKQNIIAVLDTGSGKTFIAVLLLRWIIDQELEDRAIGKPHRVSFFLVSPTYYMTDQH